jgi:hypothetical protein
MLGEVATVRYKVINEAAREIARQAGYNGLATNGRRLFQQDKLLLFHGAAPESRRDS